MQSTRACTSRGRPAGKGVRKQFDERQCPGERKFDHHQVHLTSKNKVHHIKRYEIDAWTKIMKMVVFFFFLFFSPPTIL
jgi:hypothetical protein